MTVQVRKVASISVLCSPLSLFFRREGGGFPKTEIHFAYMRQKKNKREKKVGASSKNFYDRYTSFRA